MGKNFMNQMPASNNMRHKAFRIVSHVLVGIAFAVVFALAFSIIVQFVWNRLMPAIFGLGEITYWQAFGIIILAKLLFGGFGSRRPDHLQKDSSAYSYWHRPFGESDEQGPPGRFDRDWKTYNQYWKEEGEAAFSAYMERIEKE